MKTTTIQKLITTAAVTMLFALTATSAFAFIQADFDRATKAPYTCTKPCDLSNANLSGKNFYGAVFTGANFTNANLSNTSIGSIAANGANFTGANLSGTIMTSGTMNSAIFTNAILSATTRFSGTAIKGATWIDGTRTDSLAYGLDGVNGNPPAKPKPR